MKKIETGAEFRKARQSLNMTQPDMAEYMRLPNPDFNGRQTVSRWEANKPPGPACVALEALISAKGGKNGR